MYSTNGHIKKTDKGDILIFQGDLREKLQNFLSEFNIINKNLIIFVIRIF